MSSTTPQQQNSSRNPTTPSLQESHKPQQQQQPKYNPLHSLKLCIEFICDNYEYEPHEEWRALMRRQRRGRNHQRRGANVDKTNAASGSKVSGSISHVDNSTSQQQQEMADCMDSNSQQTVPLVRQQWMKYKWTLICRHLEHFLTEDLDLDLESALRNVASSSSSDQPSSNTSPSSSQQHLDWNTDFSLLYTQLKAYHAGASSGQNASSSGENGTSAIKSRHRHSSRRRSTSLTQIRYSAQKAANRSSIRRSQAMFQQNNEHHNYAASRLTAAFHSSSNKQTDTAKPQALPAFMSGEQHSSLLPPSLKKSPKESSHSRSKSFFKNGSSLGKLSNKLKPSLIRTKSSTNAASASPPPVPSRSNRNSKQILLHELNIEEKPHAHTWNGRSRNGPPQSSSKDYKRIADELDLILQHQLKNGSTTLTSSTSTTAAVSSEEKSTTQSYQSEWEKISSEAHSFHDQYFSPNFLFYSHDRNSVLELRKMAYDREKLLSMLREYFIQPSIVDELMELLSVDVDSIDTELKQLKKIVSLPRSPGRSFATQYDAHEDFLYKYGQLLIREPKMFLRTCYVLHKRNALYWIVEDTSTFEYLSQVLTVDEAMSLLMNYGSDQMLSKLAVAILNRYSVKQLRCFLLQIINSLIFFPDAVLSCESTIVEFLISKASENFEIAQLLNWHLSVAAGHTDSDIRGMYQIIHYHLLKALQTSSEDFLQLIVKQQKLVKYLSQISSEFKGKKVSRKKKVSLLHKYLTPLPETTTDKCARFDWHSIFANESPFHLPLSSEHLVGFLPEKAAIFKSAMQPFKIDFVTKEGGSLSLMWKFGDDLRQDECVLLFIEMVDTLLLQGEHKLDLCLTPYHCLATSAESGFLELVPNVKTVSAVLSENGSIMNYFEKHNDPNEMYAVLDRYTRSLAGYCILSFLLGIGDRHLENILLAADGRLFHIDFGFIMGYDPKPFAPKIRITEDMLNVFNGIDSPGFNAFMQYSQHAYQIMRKHASLLICMMRLMTLSSLPHITEPSINKTLVKNLRLDLNDEDAFAFYRKNFSKSLIALAPKITERIHNIAQSFRD